MTAVHAFDHAEVVAGQGTVGLEIARQAPEAKLVVVPLGGGGLASGIGLAVAEWLPGRPRGRRAGGGVRALHRLARGPPADRRALGQHDLRRDRGQAAGRLHAAAGRALRGRGRHGLRRRGGRGDGDAARAHQAGGRGRGRGGRRGADAGARGGAGRRRGLRRALGRQRRRLAAVRVHPPGRDRRRPADGAVHGRARPPGRAGGAAAAWSPSTAATSSTSSTCATGSTCTCARPPSSWCSRRAARTPTRRSSTRPGPRASDAVERERPSGEALALGRQPPGPAGARSARRSPRRSSSLSSISAAGAMPSTWAGRRAPAIATCTPGCASTHATASCGERVPALLGELARARSTASRLRSQRLAREGLVAAPPVVLGERRRVEPAAQQPVGERPVDEHADVLLAAPGQHVLLDGAVEQVVGRLVGLDLDRARQLLHLAGLKFDTPTWRILPSSTSCFERGAGLLERRRRGRASAPGRGRSPRRPGARGSPRPPRAGTRGSRRAPRRRPPGAGRPWWRRSRRRGGCRPRAPRPAAASDSPKPYAWAVSKKVTPSSSAVAHGGDRLVALDRAPVAAELPGAEADARDLQPALAQLDVFHLVCLPAMSRSSPCGLSCGADADRSRSGRGARRRGAGGGAREHADQPRPAAPAQPRRGARGRGRGTRGGRRARHDRRRGRPGAHRTGRAPGWRRSRRRRRGQVRRARPRAGGRARRGRGDHRGRDGASGGARRDRAVRHRRARRGAPRRARDVGRVGRPGRRSRGSGSPSSAPGSSRSWTWPRRSSAWRPWE